MFKAFNPEALVLRMRSVCETKPVRSVQKKNMENDDDMHMLLNGQTSRKSSTELGLHGGIASLLSLWSQFCKASKALSHDEIDCLVRAGKCKDGKLDIEPWLAPNQCRMQLADGPRWAKID